METDLGQLQGVGRWGGMHGLEWVCPGTTGTLCFIWLLIYIFHIFSNQMARVGNWYPGCCELFWQMTVPGGRGHSLPGRGTGV